MKEASGWLRANGGSNKQALSASVPVGKAGDMSGRAGQLQAFKVPGKPRFPPRSDCIESIDSDPMALSKERHL